jgi:mono/diheme cytochrome c family protein
MFGAMKMHQLRAQRVMTVLVAAIAIPFGTVSLAEMSAGRTSVWSGVYSKAQAERGEKAYRGSCASCHGPKLNGAGEPDMPPSPAVARDGFLRKWSGKSVAELSEYLQKSMPPDRPGQLSAQESADVIAHMFAVSNIPAGNNELQPDDKSLANILIEQKPK